MARFTAVWHPRWTRVFIIGLFLAAISIGASLGLEQRHQPLTLAAAAAPTGAARATGTRLLDAHPRTPFFVIPQPVKYTPYGTPISMPHIGTPAQIELTNSATGNSLVSCDLISETISHTIIILDDVGESVVGAPVVFTVVRSDLPDPQIVNDITRFDGSATLTVKVPKVSAPDKSFATYSVLAEAFTMDSVTPVVSTQFAIADFTCGVAGGR